MNRFYDLMGLVYVMLGSYFFFGAVTAYRVLSLRGFVEMIEVIFAFTMNYLVVRENASAWISFLCKLRCLQCVYSFLKRICYLD